MIDGSPYYANTKMVSEDNGQPWVIHWMWHGPVGHWIINDFGMAILSFIPLILNSKFLKQGKMLIH